MAEYDLDFGKKNTYVPASVGDVGQASYAGAADGGDEPWFSEAVSTVSLDLKQAESALKAFTKEAASFKMAEFAKENGVDDKDAAMAKLVDALGYDKFLESTTKQLAKEW